MALPWLMKVAYSTGAVWAWRAAAKKRNVHATRAVSQLLWIEKDREVWFSLGENHEKACCSPDFLRCSTSREQLCATFFKESRMEFHGSANLHRKSGFDLHQLRNCSSRRKS